MNRLLKPLLSLNSLRKALGTQLFFKAIKFNYHLEIIDRLEFKRILVLAPHPDDDCFGAGGTIKKLSQNEAKITVAYFCDGAKGGTEGAKADKLLIDVRKKEAQEAGKILGIQEQVFFGYRDGQLAAGDASIKALIDLIKRIEPDIIFVPSFLDNHPDHRVVNEILVNAMAQIEIKAEIWAYEVWTPLFANRIVMINDVLEVKKTAIAKHKSQLMFRSFDKAILGLNEYRAQINNQSGYAEAFFATTPEIYKKLYQNS